MSKPRKLHSFAENAEETARREQAIQEDVDRADKAAGNGPSKKAEAM
jgi:hypothetical protein